MHCHIIPGVDDGAKTLRESMDILRDERAQGVENIILMSSKRIAEIWSRWRKKSILR